MAKYPIEKYNIAIHQHKDYGTVETIAWSTYAGKVVRGKAICHIEDTYNEQKGIKLAVARCAERIALKRQARAEKLLAKAQHQMQVAQKYLIDMTNYADDARLEVTNAKAEVADILSKM